VEQDLAWAVEQAREAGEIAMKYFRSGVDVIRKVDDSPVTIADREIEAFLRSRIADKFPNDGVLGEEFAETPGTGRRWVIDPIDGTKSFIYGMPAFSILIGLEIEGCPTMGVAHFPALNETYWGSENGAFLNAERIHVSDRHLPAALLLMGSLKAMDACGRLDAFTKLARRAYATRNWGDAYGYCLVARGDAEAMIDPTVSVWDTCAVSVIVEAAGGRFTDFRGNRGHTFGEAIACVPAVFSDLIAAFACE